MFDCILLHARKVHSPAKTTMTNMDNPTKKKKEDQLYFWQKAGKALKSPGKLEKIQKIWSETGNVILESRKVEKNLRKAGKSIFFLQKAGNRPPIPSPQRT